MLDDGLYIIRRGLDTTLGEIKTATLHAYNDHHLDFFVTKGVPIGTFTDPKRTSHKVGPTTSYDWANWPHNFWLQDDQDTYLVAYWDEGEDIFSFPDPEVSSGSIINVSIQMFSQGSGRTVLKVGSNYYYGNLTSQKYMFEWTVTDYAINPYSEDAWTWEDLAAGTLLAGIDLYSPHGVMEPELRYENEEGLFGEDARFYEISTKCRYFKVVVTYLNEFLEEDTIELWPDTDVEIAMNYDHSDSTYRLVPLIGNPLHGSLESRCAEIDEADNLKPYLQIRAGIEAGFPDGLGQYSSDLSLTLPNFSVPITIEVSAAWTTTYIGSPRYAKLFLEYNGERYYGDTVSDPEITTSTSYEWAVSPATGLAWTYDEFSSLRFGLECNGAVYDSWEYFQLRTLDAEIQWQEIAGEAVEYQKIDEFRFISAIRRPGQNFKADEYIFHLPNGYLPERTEIVLVKHGQPIFQGIVWTAQDMPNGEVKITIKSQQILLENRYLPTLFYYPRCDRFDHRFNLDDTFSDNAPQQPYGVHFARLMCPWPFYWYVWNADMGWWGSRETPFLAGGIELLMNHETKIGLFYILNSILPYGHYTNDTIPGLWHMVTGRAKFLTNHDPTTNAATDFHYTVDYATRLSTVHSTEFYPDVVGSVRRFGPGQAGSLALDEYAVDGDDIILPHFSGAFMPLFDHALDTHLRPGTNDMGAKILSVPYTFGGESFAKSFSDFFARMGQEARFRSELRDGNVYMDVAEEIGVDTGRKFIDGVNNSRITKTIPRDPPIDMVVGSQVVGGVATSWERSLFPWAAKIVNIQDRDGEDLQEWLDALLQDDATAYTIDQLGEEWLLLPGDWIYVQPHGDGLIPVRITGIQISPGKTRIAAGRRLAAPDEIFGEWRLATASLDLDYQIQSTEFDFGDAAGTQDFTIYADDYADGGWKCRVEISWSLQVDEGVIVDLPDGLFMFLIAKINDKVVPPGRFLTKGNSGSCTIDITNLCDVSISADTTNTLSVELVNGQTGVGYGHVVSGEIKQYRRLEAIENA